MREFGDLVKNILFGTAIGDALGVPYEFLSRDEMSKQPALELKGFGSHHQPMGTFSDDSSMMFCIAEALTEPKFRLENVAENFSKWLFEAYWTANGEVFDVGNTTRLAIQNFKNGKPALLSGLGKETDCGNGSLMRTLILLPYVINQTFKGRFRIVGEVSSITHSHTRCIIACMYLTEFANLLFDGSDKFKAYQLLQHSFVRDLTALYIEDTELEKFDRLLTQNVYMLAENQINSGGYVIDTLEASIWCLLTTENYKDAVLKAANLGGDTDTTAAVTGGLAGILYGYQNIPIDWMKVLARKDDIYKLAEKVGGNLKTIL